MFCFPNVGRNVTPESCFFEILSYSRANVRASFGKKNIQAEEVYSGQIVFLLFVYSILYTSWRGLFWANHFPFICLFYSIHKLKRSILGKPFSFYLFILFYIQAEEVYSGQIVFLLFVYSILYTSWRGLFWANHFPFICLFYSIYKLKRSILGKPFSFYLFILSILLSVAQRVPFTPKKKRFQ